LTLARKAKAPEIAEALSRLLLEPSFRDAARRLAREIASGAGTADFVTEIEALASTRAPKSAPA